METVSAWIEAVGAALDAAGVILITFGLLIAASRYFSAYFGSAQTDAFLRLRQDIGRAILLGLEVLVAADIIRTIAVTPTLTSIGVLAGIVAIRTILSLSLQVEVEGRFPWQAERAKDEGFASETGSGSRAEHASKSRSRSRAHATSSSKTEGL